MDKIINTISTIFKERYGTELNIQWTQNSGEKNPVFKSHWQNSFVYSRTLRQVSFPLFNRKNELRAIAVASPVENKDAIIFDEMASFLQLTVAEHMVLKQDNDKLADTERAIHLAHNDSPNIIQFKSKKTQTQHIQFKKRELKKKPSTDSLWISGNNTSMASHIAFSVHDWVSNWAFINAREIPDLIWQDKNHWKNFPQITIFIPDIEDLTDHQLDILEENLKVLSPLKDKKPLIVVTSRGELNKRLESIKALFKHYKSNENVPARAQAHFLLFHHKNQKPWSHYCKDTGKLFFLPFNQSPDHWH